MKTAIKTSFVRVFPQGACASYLTGGLEETSDAAKLSNPSNAVEACSESGRALIPEDSGGGSRAR